MPAEEAAGWIRYWNRYPTLRDIVAAVFGVEPDKSDNRSPQERYGEAIVKLMESQAQKD